MKEALNKLNKLFENRVRLGIMSLLMVNERVDFLNLKKTLGQTDGNLASHLNTLEKHEYLEVQKGFIGRKTQTHYAATPAGRKAFEAHLNALEEILKNLPGN